MYSKVILCISLTVAILSVNLDVANSQNCQQIVTKCVTEMPMMLKTVMACGELEKDDEILACFDDGLSKKSAPDMSKSIYKRCYSKSANNGEERATCYMSTMIEVMETCQTCLEKMQNA